jgi:hypothetical protein
MNWSNRRNLIVLAGATVMVGLPCSAATIVFQQGVAPSADYAHHAVTVRSQYPQSTAGGAGDLLAGNSGPGHTLRAVLGFDLTAIPRGAQIDKVEIEFRQAADAASADESVELVLLEYFALVSEGNTSWRDAQGQLGPPLGIVRMNPRSGVKITFRTSDALVVAAQEALDFGLPLGLALRLRDEGFAGRRLILLRGNEYAAPASRPKLTIHYSVRK